MILTALFVGVVASAAMAGDDAVYTVEKVTVDITAKNAAAAREEAFIAAQQTAFRQLAERLLSEEDLTRFTLPEIGHISPMIKDFEITDERLSSVQYVGTYTFRFDGNAVRSFLGTQGVAYTDVSRKPVLILPFYQDLGRTILWGEDNPWLAAWARADSYAGLVPVVIPIGDLEDVADMGSAETLSYDPEGMKRILTRYGTADAVIIAAAPVRAESGAVQALGLSLYRADGESPAYLESLKVTAEGEETPDALYDRAVKSVRKTLQKEWKEQTVVSSDPGEVSTLRARVSFSAMQEWVETQKTLRRVPGVNAIKLISLKSNEAMIELAFAGSEERLRLALAQADMTLSAPQVNFESLAPLTYSLYLNKYAPVPY